MIDGAAKFCGQLVRECLRPRILATSREPLGIDGEHVYRVPSLSLPPGEAEAVDDIAASDAVRNCLLLTRRIGLHLDISELLFGAACCTAWQGDHLRAARLHGVADREMSAALAVGSISWPGPERELREREQGSLRRLMGDEEYDAAFRSGARLSRSQAVDLALGRETPG